MLPHNEKFLRSQPALLRKDAVRNANLSDIMQKPRLADDFHQIVFQSGMGRQRRGIGRDTLGVIERIVVFGVDGSRQGENGGSELLNPIFCLFGFRLRYSSIIDLNIVLSVLLDLEHCHICIGKQLISIGAGAWIAADSR